MDLLSAITRTNQLLELLSNQLCITNFYLESAHGDAATDVEILKNVALFQQAVSIQREKLQF